MKKRYYFLRKTTNTKPTATKLILLILAIMIIYNILSKIVTTSTVEVGAVTTECYSLQKTFETVWTPDLTTVEITTEPKTEETTTEPTTEPVTETVTDVHPEQEVPTTQNQLVSLGEFRISHYCPCSICNGGYNTTALGTSVTPYRTIAVDSTIIPLGSKVMIGDKTYIAEDTGGAIKGNKIDLCVSSHDEAYAKGVKYENVYLLK